MKQEQQREESLSINGKVFQFTKIRSQSGLKRQIVELVLNAPSPDDDCMLCDFLMALQYILDSHSNAYQSERIIPVAELQDTLCRVSQLIAGWNATEIGWSDWDEQVYKEVVQLQIKINGLTIPAQALPVKTLQECKDEVAKSNGFPDHYTCLRTGSRLTMNRIANEAAELYASQFKNQSK